MAAQAHIDNPMMLDLRRPVPGHPGLLRRAEQALQHLAPEAAFFRDVEPQEYRETVARRQAALDVSQGSEMTFPETI